MTQRRVVREPASVPSSLMSSSLRLERVAVVVDDGVAPFELGVACELFGLDRSDQGLPTPAFALAAVTPGQVRTTAGFELTVLEGLPAARDADLIVLPAGQWTDRVLHPELVASLTDAHARGTHIMAICRGAFVLAATGLLDGRRATTHWRWTDEFGRRHPTVELDPDVLYVDHGDVSTSAGTAAGIDLGLHLLRRAHGAATAADIARRMVVAPHREGGQAQYTARPLLPRPGADGLEDTARWAIDHLDRPLTVDLLAARANMAPRTFARRFRQLHGTTPHQWLTHQRVGRAQELLETTDQSMALVAARSGFGSTDALRAAFARELTISPARYRQQFTRASSPTTSMSASRIRQK